MEDIEKPKFKVGDRVRLVKRGCLGWESEEWADKAFAEAKIPLDGIATISGVQDDEDTYGTENGAILYRFTYDVRIEGSNYWFYPEHLELADATPEKAIKDMTIDELEELYHKKNTKN